MIRLEFVLIYKDILVIYVSNIKEVEIKMGLRYSLFLRYLYSIFFVGGFYVRVSGGGFGGFIVDFLKVIYF